MIPLSSERTPAFKGAVTVPGDKSISHRALMLSSQSPGNTSITGLLEGEDVLNTAKALQSLGVSIERKANGNWQVEGVGIGGLKESVDMLDMGNSGTSIRLLMGLVTPYPFTTFFTGDHSLRSRPMGRVITPLTQMGAKFAARDGKYLPLALTGTINPTPVSYTLPVASAQVKSAILLAGLNTPGMTTVIEAEPTRDHTENMLRFFGVDITTKSKRMALSPFRLSADRRLNPKTALWKCRVTLLLRHFW
jgi:3-phosphoshikimate 1-carboxyvinyltransferase